MRIVKRADIAMRLLMFRAANDGRPVTKSGIAERCKTSEFHLARIVNPLARLGFPRNQRGRTGGATLARPAAEIRVGAVFRRLEEITPVTECCADAETTCPLIGPCRWRGACADAVEAVHVQLDEVTLEPRGCDATALLSLFSVARGPQQP